MVARRIGAAVALALLMGCAARHAAVETPTSTSFLVPSDLLSTLEPSDVTRTALPAAVVGKVVEVVAFERTAGREALLFARPLRLRFGTDGTVELTMACAGNSGTYEVEGDRIAFEEFGVAAIGCPALTDPNWDEAALGILLESRAQPTLAGDALRVEFAGFTVHLTVSPISPR